VERLGATGSCRLLPLLGETPLQCGWVFLIFLVGLWVVGGPGFMALSVLLRQRGKEAGGPAGNVPGPGPVSRSCRHR